VNETRLTGLENLRTRFARLAALPSLKPALRDEAEAVARLARANLSTRGTGELARSIDVAEMKTEKLGRLPCRHRRSGRLLRRIRHLQKSRKSLAFAGPAWAFTTP